MQRYSILIAAVLVSACSAQRTQSAAADDHTAHMAAADTKAPQVTPSASSQNSALPASANAAEARIKASPRHAEWVKIATETGSKDSIMAWVVYPATRAKAPVVVVVHEIYGLQTWVRGVADQVAADGFIAVAPDFISRARGGPSSVELRADSATGLIRGVDAAERNRVILAAANYGMMLPSAEQRYAVIGYCWGGSAVFGHAVHGGVKGFAGGVAYYGMPYTSGGQRATAATPAVPASIAVDSLRKIKAPVMLLNGSKDARIAAAMPAIDSIMKSLGKEYTGVNYEGAIHGFLRAQDDPRAARANEDDAVVKAEQTANYAATKDAWPRTIAFLRRVLK
jgi:carboxymethylenebutenolidase